MCREWMNKKSGGAYTPNFDWRITCSFNKLGGRYGQDN